MGGHGVEEKKKKKIIGENDVKPVMGNEDFSEGGNDSPNSLIAESNISEQVKGPFGVEMKT